MKRKRKTVREQENLVAPCGVYCGICSGYLAYSRNIPKQRGRVRYCIGCRPRDKQCAFLKGHCPTLRNCKIEFCYKCKTFPCERLKRIDERYRRNYRTSLIENLEEIKSKGVSEFLKAQEKKYKRAKCGGTICVHNGLCYDCGQEKLFEILSSGKSICRIVPN